MTGDSGSGIGGGDEGGGGGGNPFSGIFDSIGSAVSGLFGGGGGDSGIGASVGGGNPVADAGNANNFDFSNWDTGGDVGGGSSSYAPTDTVGSSGSGSVDDFLSNPGGGGGGSNPLAGAGNANNFDFSNWDGSGGNLSGPGPVGGDSGLPGAGGGTNTPLAAGGVFAPGGALADAGNANNFDFSGAPGGASASSVAAPAGVSGSGDLTSGGGDASTTGTGGGASTSSGGKSGGSDFLSSLGIKPGLGTAIAGAGLLSNLINGNKTSDAVAALQQQATQGNARAQQIIDQGQAQNAGGQGDVGSGRDMLAKGSALQDYIATGKLPQGYEDQVQQAAQAAKTQIISRYATMGQNTNPQQNSVLAQELQQIDARLPAMREQLASQLATSGNSIVGAGNQTISTGSSEGTNLINSGLQAAGISSGIYTQLAQLDQTRKDAQGKAIANFAAALSNTPKSISVSLPGST